MQTALVKPHFSIPSIIAIVAAIVSFFVSPSSGFLLAMIAIGFGVLGLLLSFSPSIRGGIVSTFSLILASIGIVAAIIKAFVQ